MKKFFLPLFIPALVLLWACHTNPDGGATTITVQGDSSWAGFDSLRIDLLDTNGALLDNLFHAKLTNLSELQGLSGSKYKTDDAVFHILGYHGDTLVFEQTRVFHESTGKAEVETTLVVGAPLASLALSVGDSLVLYTGLKGEDSIIHATGSPKYARPRLAWTDSGDAVELAEQAGGWAIDVLPKHEGNAQITVQPQGADKLRRVIYVRVIKDAPVLDVSPARSFIEAGGKVEFSIQARQAHGVINQFAYDLDGDGKWDTTMDGSWSGTVAQLPKQSHLYAANGKYTVRFHVRDSEGNETDTAAEVNVGERKPTVQLSPHDTTISIGDTVFFHGLIQEIGGKLASYAWDFNGDGKAEDSTSASDTAVERSVSHVFPDSGVFIVKLRAWDADQKMGVDSMAVTVLRDAPVLDPGAPVTSKSRVPVAFSGTATQKFGSIVMYKWDYDGDGKFDDSSAAPLATTHAYPLEGVYKAVFYARDDDGNEVKAIRTVTISDAPFIILSVRADTTVSIKDSVLFTASVRNDDGKALKYGWDFNGAGKFEDSAASSQTTVNYAVKHAYPLAAVHHAVFKVMDEQGKTLADTVIVNVLLDPPVADLGPDTTLLVGATLKVHVLGSDKFGTIVKRELSIGGGGFIPLSQQDTTLTLPDTKGNLILVGRVTDDDGQTGSDSMTVHVLYSSENRLNGIFLSPPGTSVKPDFNPDSLAYAGSVGNTVTSVVVGAAALDKKASVTVNGSALSPSVTSVSVALKVGLNAIPIIVTAQDSSVRTYTLNFTRLPSANAYLSSLILSPPIAPAPAFNAAVQAYTYALPDTLDSLQLKATVAEPNAKITVNGNALAAGTLSPKIAAPVGNSTVTVEVTAQDGTTKLDYVLTLKRPSWQLAGAAGFSPAHASFASMVVDNGTIYAAFVDSTNKSKPLVMRKDSTGWTSLAPASLPDTAGWIIKLFAHAGTVYLGYEGPGPGIGYPTLYVRKFTGGTWTQVGTSIGLAPAGHDGFDLDWTPKDSLLVEVQTSYMTTFTSVYKFNGATWDYIAATATADTSRYTQLAVNPATGTAYLAWIKPLAGGGKFNAFIDTLAANVPVPLLTSSWSVANVPMAFALDPSGTPYYAYAEPTGTKLAVKKFTGSAWVDVGAVGFSDGAVSQLRLAFLGSAPVVAYRDAALGKVAIKTWTGSAWAPLGNTDVSPGDVGLIDLAAAGTSAWVGFGDATAGNRGTVKQRILP